MNTVPCIPKSAPFTAEQRNWLNGYFAGLFSNAAQADASPAVSRLRVPVLIGSQSGNAETLGYQIADDLQEAGFDSPALGMERFKDLDLTKENRLLIVTSTWGEGDPPDNAVEFYEFLAGPDAPRLDDLQYAICALGDSSYLEFCGAGKKFDVALAALGAKAFHERVDCDVEFEDSARTWFRAVQKKLEDAQAASPESPKVSTAADRLPNASSAAPAARFSKQNPFRALLAVNRSLHASPAHRDTRHIEFDLSGSGLTYEAGDVLGVVPQNCVEAVGELIAALKLDPDTAVALPDGRQASLRVGLQNHFGMTQPSRKLLTGFADRAGDPNLSALLAPDRSADLAKFLWGREIIDLVTEYPRTRFSAGEFVGLLSKLKPRLYSISSSPKAHPRHVHLTVAAVRYESFGRKRKGVCSTYLSERVNGDNRVPVFVQPAKHFKPPADDGAPMIMCGPGTGIAPFRAFLQERQAAGARGRNWLFFGNPHRQTDFLYSEELKAMRNSGHLTRLDLAWSRDQAEKLYVQHRMLESGAELWRWLEEGACFYVCGDAKRMAGDVDAALHRIIAEHGACSDEDAASYVAKMKRDKRYQRDVY